MQKLYKIVGSIALLLIIVTTVIFSLGFILVAVAVVSLLGIYKYSVRTKSSRKFKTRPYSKGEVIDLQSEVIHETIQAKKSNKF